MEETSLFQERDDMMVSPTGGNPTFRTAHFLNPSVNSINGPNLKLPSLPLSHDSDWPLKVTFNGWRDPPRKWNSWVNRMHSLYQSVWKQAGIYDAILASTYQTRINNQILFGIAERWCCETNTFIFPWGEATITLEDMMILGGFSVLGCPVSMPLQTKDLCQLEESLKGLVRSKTSKVRQGTWLNYFMENKNEFEHEAFLSLWLSRFVFPGNSFDTIGKHVLPIAVHLSKGTRIALAPAVLASIYRDLSLLRETISASVELGDGVCEDSYLALTLWAPLRFVQIWAWERIPQLQPKPNFIDYGCHRLARWHSMKRLIIDNVRRVIDSAGEDFRWRPYAMAVDNWLFPNFYKEKEHWVSCNQASDEEIESFVRCLRVSDLVGIDCIEPYLPHRVAMQFGMDQDLPKWVPRSMATPEIAWNFYSRPIKDARLYFPPRLFESDVTVRYLEWWKKSVLSLHVAVKGVVKRKRTPRRSKRILSLNSMVKVKVENDLDVPPGFPPKCCSRVEGVELGNDVVFPPGFPPKCCISVEGDKQTVVGMLQTSNKLSSEDRAACNDNKSLEQIEKVIKSEVIEFEAGSSIKNTYSINQNDQERSGSSLEFEKSVLELEARVSKLERLVAIVKAARFGYKCAEETIQSSI